MNTQETFNKVVRHLLTQNKRSLDDSFLTQAEKNDGAEGACRYRGPNGLQCAIGCLIPEELYERKMEGRVFGGLFEFPGLENYLKPLLVMSQNEDGFFDGNGFSLGSRLQKIHDSTDPRNWEKRLRETATEFNLEFPQL